MRGAKLFLSEETRDGCTNGIPGIGFFALEACTNPPVMATLSPAGKPGIVAVVSRVGSNPTKRPLASENGPKKS